MNIHFCSVWIFMLFIKWSHSCLKSIYITGVSYSFNSFNNEYANIDSKFYRDNIAEKIRWNPNDILLNDSNETSHFLVNIPSSFVIHSPYWLTWLRFCDTVFFLYLTRAYELKKIVKSMFFKISEGQRINWKSLLN